MKVCPNCKGANLPNAVFCSVCASSIRDCPVSEDFSQAAVDLKQNELSQGFEQNNSSSVSSGFSQDNSYEHSRSSQPSPSSYDYNMSADSPQIDEAKTYQNLTPSDTDYGSFSSETVRPHERQSSSADSEQGVQSGQPQNQGDTWPPQNTAPTERPRRSPALAVLVVGVLVLVFGFIFFMTSPDPQLDSPALDNDSLSAMAYDEIVEPATADDSYYVEPYYDVMPLHALTPAQIFEKNAYAVFSVLVSFGGREDIIGSGFFITDTGVAVTNHHVMAGWPYASVKTHDGEQFDILGYYFYDFNNDIAIIVVDGLGTRFQYVTLGDPNDLRVGDDVFTIGTPLGAFQNTFSSGILSGFVEVSEYDIYRVYDMLQFTAPISPGNSGGPLFNDRGEVVGINSAAVPGYIGQNLNFAVPIDRVDLHSYVGGQFMQLPIGSDMYSDIADYRFLVGTWQWSGGYYIFNADGTGSRDWNQAPGTFSWSLSGRFLVINHRGERESWSFERIDQDLITIGGALFYRTDNAEMIRYEDVFGTWTWSEGMYIFHYCGTGWRDWALSPGIFEWELRGRYIYIFPDFDDDESWQILLIDENRLSIGGAPFVRYAGLPPTEPIDFVVEVFTGTWMWVDGYYTFYADGTGYHTCLDGDVITLYWTIRRNRISFYYEDGYSCLCLFRIIDNNTLSVGGYLFERLE